MFLVEQQVYLWVGNVLLLWKEVTLHCIEMVVQHLHLGVLHGIEFMSFGLVVMMVMGVVDVGFFRILLVWLGPVSWPGYLLF